MTTAIALMLQKDSSVMKENGSYNVDAIIRRSYDIAKQLVPQKSQVDEDYFQCRFLKSK